MEIVIESPNHQSIKMQCIAKEPVDNCGGLWRCQILSESVTRLTLMRSPSPSRQAVFSGEESLRIMTFQTPVRPDAFIADLETFFTTIANSIYADGADNGMFAANFLRRTTPDSRSECEAMVLAKRLKSFFAAMFANFKEGKCPESVWQAGVLYIVAATAADEDADQ